MGILNQCGACGEDFTSVTLFDKHRVGPHDNGRRCLSVRELERKGFERNDRGQWFDPVQRDRARQAFMPA